VIPAYISLFNKLPLEEASFTWENILRKAQARMHEALVEAIGWTLEVISRQDTIGWFGHGATRQPISYCENRCRHKSINFFGFGLLFLQRLLRGVTYGKLVSSEPLSKAPTGGRFTFASTARVETFHGPLHVVYRQPT
jgi:hypothetical protein